MGSVNKVIIVGNLGRDPETRYMPSGDAITTISVATSDTWKDKTTGEKKEHTEWHRIVFFTKLAEIAGQYLKKGTSVYVEGALRTSKYKDKDGVEKYSTEIRGDQMRILSSRSGTPDQEGAYDHPGTSSAPPPTPASSAARSSPIPPAPQPAHAAPDFSDMDDDIPF